MLIIGKRLAAGKKRRGQEVLKIRKKRERKGIPYGRKKKPPHQSREGENEKVLGKPSALMIWKRGDRHHRWPDQK